MSYRKNIVAQLNMEKEEKVRDEARRSVLLAKELKIAGYKPSWFGHSSNPKVSEIYKDIKKFRKIVFDYPSDVYDESKDRIKEVLEINDCYVIDDAYEYTSDNGPMTRILVDIAKYL